MIRSADDFFGLDVIMRTHYTISQISFIVESCGIFLSKVVAEREGMSAQDPQRRMNEQGLEEEA